MRGTFRNRTQLAALGLFSLALLTPRPAAAQGDDSQTVPTFRSESNLVVVPVEVRDSAGRPVRNLQVQDFRILQNHKEQRIASLDEIQGAADPTAPQPASLAVPDGEAARAATTSGSAGLQHLILVFDQVNTEAVDQERGKEQLRKALQKFDRPDVAVSLVVVDRRGSRLAWGPRRGVNGLAAAIAALPAKPPVAYETGKDLLRAKDQVAVGMATSFSVRTLDASYQQVAIRSTLAAFRQIASAYRAVRGKKIVLWVTGGFPFQASPAGSFGAGGNSTREFDLTFQILNDAQIAIYPVDVRGLSYVGLPTADYPSTDLNQKHPEIHVDIVSAEQAATISTMEQVAEVTGGRAYVNRNDLSGVLTQAATDGDHYYLLAYKLDRSRLKPGFQTLQVRTARKHAAVRARSGFFIAAQ